MEISKIAHACTMTTRRLMDKNAGQPHKWAPCSHY